ncbi:MAG: phosphoribosylglycinamide formyltransferase [Acidaminobacteraceae bacterium]
MKKIAVFISGNGSNLEELIKNTKSKCINGEIALVISDNENAYGLVRAINSNIPSMYIGRGNYEDISDRASKTINELKRFNIDFIVLAGYLSIVPPKVINIYRDKIINIHPSLIPKYSGKGFYGDLVHRAVLDHGEEYSGATVHFVDEGIDSGKIIAQEKVMIDKNETIESLKSKIHDIEHKILIEAVANLCS